MKPMIAKTKHLLPFDELSPSQFERLCLWLVARQGYLRGEHLGEAGSEQGRDVIAYKSTDAGEQLWYFQCKRCKRISAQSLIREIDKLNSLVACDPTKKPFGIVFVTSANLSAAAREKIQKYCQMHSYACEFWGRTELDLLVKSHHDIIEEFFNTGATAQQTATDQMMSEFEAIRLQILASRADVIIGQHLYRLKNLLFKYPSLLARRDVLGFYQTWIAPYDTALEFAASFGRPVALSLTLAQWKQLKEDLLHINLRSASPLPQPIGEQRGAGE